VDLWEIEAVANLRFVRVWTVDADSEHSLILVDRATDGDRETVGSLRPVGAIWGLSTLTILAWDQGYDGGQYSILTVDTESVQRVISAGGGSC
jgi:hypothetical protein